MLDPCQRSRASISEVLCHPWLNPIPRKSSLQLPPNHTRRRVGISHSRSAALAITQTVISEVESTMPHGHEQQQCTCIEGGDYGIGLRCPQCEELLVHSMKHPNRPIGDSYSTTKASMISIASSGYSSSSESLPTQCHTPLSYKCLPFQEDDNIDIVFV